MKSDLAERLRRLRPVEWWRLRPELCAVVEAAGEYRQSIMDDAGSYEEGQRWVNAGHRLETAWATLARRMDEVGL